LRALSVYAGDTRSRVRNNSLRFEQARFAFEHFKGKYVRLIVDVIAFGRARRRTMREN